MYSKQEVEAARQRYVAKRARGEWVSGLKPLPASKPRLAAARALVASQRAKPVKANPGRRRNLRSI